MKHGLRSFDRLIIYRAKGKFKEGGDLIIFALFLLVGF